MIQKFWKPYDFSWLYLKRAAELEPRYYFNTFKADLHKQRSKKNSSCFALNVYLHCTLIHCFVLRRVSTEAVLIGLDVNSL